MLALHGWRRDHRDFDAVLSGHAPGTAEGPFARLSDDSELPGDPLDAIALDLPGFGATPEPDGPWGSDEYAEAVGRLLAELEPGVVLLGHSFGARVAVKMAARWPEAVGGVVLTGAPLFPAEASARSAPPLRLRVARSLAHRGLVPESKLEELRQRYGSEDYKAASPVMRGVLVQAIKEEREGGYSEALAAISSPVELVWGALDTAAPVRVAEQIAAGLSGPSRLEVHEGAGHLTPDLIPGDLRAAVDRLLASRPAR